MNEETFERLEKALSSACGAVGLKAETIKTIGPGVINLGDTGVAIFWTSDGANGDPAWFVRETYQLKEGEDQWRPVTQTVVIVPEREYIRVAKCALLLVSERRLDSRLNRNFSS